MLLEFLKKQFFKLMILLDFAEVLPEYTHEQLLIELQESKREWQFSQLYFDNVIEIDLIDHAIFLLGAAERKYDYLLKKAKNEGLRG